MAPDAWIASLTSFLVALVRTADAGQAEALSEAPVSLVCELDSSLWLQHQVSFKGLAQQMPDFD